jgi:hypothetical protein
MSSALAQEATAELQTAGTAPNVRAVSFSGCGWLLNYAIGTSQALRDAGVIHGDPRQRYGATRCVGVSGGALTAACAALDIDSSIARSVVNEMHAQATTNWRMKFRLDELLDEGLPRLAPQFESAPARWAAKYGSSALGPATWQDLARGRLGIHFGFLNRTSPYYHVGVRNEYASYFDLSQTLTASCLLPGFATLRHLRSTNKQVELDKGGANTIPDSANTALDPLVIDGGLLEPQPECHEFNVLNVSPIWIARFLPWWPVDICPRYIPITWAVFPPADAPRYDALFTLGYRDGMSFAVRNGFVTDSIAQEFQHQNGCFDPEIAVLEPTPLPHMTKAVAGVSVSGVLMRQLWRRMRPRRV